MASVSASSPAPIALSKRVQRYGTLMVAQVAMASGALFGRLALSDGRPTAIAAIRLGMVSLPLLVRMAVMRRPLLGRAIEMRLGFAAFLLTAQFFLWTQALSRLSVSATTLLVCCTPLWNGLFDVFVRRRKLPGVFWVAMAVAMGGVALLVTGHAPTNVPLPGETGLGIAMALGCSLSASTYMILVKQVTRMSHAGSSPSMVDIITRTFAGGAVLLSILAVVMQQQPPPLEHTSVWAGILGMAVVTQAVGHALQNVSLKNLPTRTVSFATLVEPLLSTLAAAALFGESVGLGAMAGGVLILVGVGWAMFLGEG